MYTVDSVAEYIIMRCNQMGKTISNLKLQKILYFVQAEFLVAKDQPCFPERIEAWDFGPVVPDAYHQYKFYGSASIPFMGQDCSRLFSIEDKALIDGIIEQCAKYSASTLVEITHHQAPWQNAYRSRHNNVIDPESIKGFFKEAE